MPPPFLGWTPRNQWGFHLRRVGGDLFYPGGPAVPELSLIHIYETADACARFKKAVHLQVVCEKCAVYLCRHCVNKELRRVERCQD